MDLSEKVSYKVTTARSMKVFSMEREENARRHYKRLLSVLLMITFGFSFPECSGKKESSQGRNLLQKNNCPVHYTAQQGYNEHEDMQ